ncbi:MAG TPA: alpha/beta hydrolase [Acetobacteraceae bacterium]|nr:alpha/beta hydrolase [Acetobacteraceae bacterium]
MTTMRAGTLDLDMFCRGAGQPILLIHGVNPISPQAPFVDMLARQGTVIAPSHPGFGPSSRPPDFDTMYDLVNLYRDVLDTIDAPRISVIGFSFGGWIAAELAVGGAAKLDRLVLVDAVGIKLGGREQRDIVHFFNTDPADLNRRAWHDPARQPNGIHGLGWQATIGDAMTDDELVSLARNWDSLCLYGWKPHMFNPQLAFWLRRIAVPTLVLWGESDRVVTPDYGRAYAQRIPQAVFQTIAAAGHHPELEQPAAFVERVAAFLNRGA